MQGPGFLNHSLSHVRGGDCETAKVCGVHCQQRNTMALVGFPSLLYNMWVVYKEAVNKKQ